MSTPDSSTPNGDVTAGPASDRALKVARERLAVIDERITAPLVVRARPTAALREATGARVRPAA
ncbi:hypothetical protein ABZV31_23370 [Streptomyces sp. NPDC005202]|uniref:hypothetical protein n=1 Tax=Streptomyces sp. NPDC005202 TaxID=3157021 RepID=UPI0033A54405